MKHMLLFYIFFGIFFLNTSCSSDSSENNDGPELPLAAETFMDVPYGDNDQQRYDLYLPANRSTEYTKVIILVHGGGWTEGDKADMDYIIPFLKSSHPNHAIVNMNYILANLQTPAFPNQFEDIQAVISKLFNERVELQINPEFALIGASAGAHLSLMYDSVYDEDDKVKMVVDIVGPTDFTDPYYSENPNFGFLLSALVDESAYPTNTDYAVAVSPALQISNTTSPTLLFYGNADPLVPLTNGERLNTALTNANIEHNFSVYEGGHGDNWSQADYLDVQNQISSYINSYLEVNTEL
ncbi:alpha/beta hydrolase [Aequorivita echinoideorum]|uniref:Alpha/beta hydrolase n=1 Tax=Aequorivita echinoideorum TaxID=1549647 RepID=A0ABS5S6A3_9FLAO|nr:alpha/beta hydrolase [Aequorivita echinoideorum]MBT0608523.1 alpha/beta hydrolase [Aequorivita echinoideorum]